MEKVIVLKPYFSHTIWGGTRLRDEFGYDEPGDDIGECWGISAHPSGESVVAGGAFDGMPLSKLWNENRELFGNVKGDVFPLLVKIIDAKDDLSIQVHPDDKYAYEHENGSLGKKECWYVLDCPDGAELVIGHNAKTGEELCKMIDDGKWDALIRKVPVKKGDIIQIDPGTVHAITSGVCVLETQQSSDITYRLYDYDRKRHGEKRPLHLTQSKDVITVPAADAKAVIRNLGVYAPGTLTEMVSCDKYTVYYLKVSGECRFSIDTPFLNASVLSGSGKVFDMDVRKGAHMIITSEGARLVCLSGEMELVISCVPCRKRS